MKFCDRRSLDHIEMAAQSENLMTNTEGGTNNTNTTCALRGRVNRSELGTSLE